MVPENLPKIQPSERYFHSFESSKSYESIVTSPGSSCYPSDRESVTDSDSSDSDTECEDVFSEATEGDLTPVESCVDNDDESLSFHTVNQMYQSPPELPPRRAHRNNIKNEEPGFSFSTWDNKKKDVL